jgi:hypothetical protein
VSALSCFELLGKTLQPETVLLGDCFIEVADQAISQRVRLLG